MLPRTAGSCRSSASAALIQKTSSKEYRQRRGAASPAPIPPGADLKTVQDQLGHASTVLTATSTPLLPAVQHKAVSQLRWGVWVCSVVEGICVLRWPVEPWWRSVWPVRQTSRR